MLLLRFQTIRSDPIRPSAEHSKAEAAAMINVCIILIQENNMFMLEVYNSCETHSLLFLNHPVCFVPLLCFHWLVCSSVTSHIPLMCLSTPCHVLMIPIHIGISIFFACWWACTVSTKHEQVHRRPGHCSTSSFSFPGSLQLGLINWVDFAVTHPLRLAVPTWR